MTIKLNHTIVPARDKQAAARLFADLFGLRVADEKDEWFAKVRPNKDLTLLFSDEDARFTSHHYAFHVTDAEFDAILKRVKAAGLAFGSEPGDPDNGKLNRWNGGRGFYFKTPDGHLLELMTQPQ